MAVTALMVGGVVSTIVTVVVAVLVLSASSVAVNVTVVVPNGKTAGALLVTVTLVSQLSVAVGSGTVTGVPARLVCSAVIAGGTLLMTGGTLSDGACGYTSSFVPAVKLRCAHRSRPRRRSLLSESPTYSPSIPSRAALV